MENVAVLIEQSQKGDREVRTHLIEQNLGLVRHIVKRYQGRGCDPEDLFQIGVIGLIKAVDHFDLEREVQFSTYAVPMIMGEIKRFFRDDGIVKVSRGIKENAYRIRQSMEQYASQHGREASVQELQELTGLDREDIVLALEAGYEVESIYQAAYKNDDSTIWLECESDIDLSAELDARSTNAAENQMDELDFYMDLIEIGITPEMVERNLSKEAADHMREFCEDHALY